MQSLSQMLPSAQVFQHLGEAVDSTLTALQRSISESSAEVAHRRMTERLALKAAITPPIFEIDAPVSYVQRGIIVHTDGRVLDQTRHGVLVEFEKIGQLWVNPESLCRLG